MIRKAMTAAVLAVGAATISAGPALAVCNGTPTCPEPNNLAAPGVLGLVAIGILGAIALARWRK